MEEARYGLSIGPEPNPKHLLRGKDEILGKAGAVMAELGKMLWVDGKKFRVTIECDPELGLFEMKRDDFS